MRRGSGSVLFMVLWSGLVSSAWGQIVPQANAVKLGVKAQGCVSDRPPATPAASGLHCRIENHFSADAGKWNHDYA